MDDAALQLGQVDPAPLKATAFLQKWRDFKPVTPA
jgi:hypothetical protein